MSTSTAPAADPQTLSLVQYVHPEKAYFWMPGLADPAVVAGMYQLDPATYEDIKAGFTAAARGAAEELLAEPDFAQQVDRLPFAAGETVLVAGESDTDSLQSWFEIVRHLLTLRRSDDNIQLVNQGISAQTTTQALGRFISALAQKPTWIVCALGANDAARHGREPTKTLVSLDETIANLTQMRRIANQQTEAEWIWLTRPPVDEARMRNYEPFKWGQTVWLSADMEAVNDWLRRQPELVVDMQQAFGDPIPVAFQEPDGLHPTLAGQQAIAREFVVRLTA